jgi:NADH-quinone oxidoreductase subunit M
LLYIGIKNYPKLEIFEVVEWVKTPYINVSLGFLIDGISFPIALIIALVTALACIYSVSYLEHEEGHSAYFSYYLIYTTGMLGAVLSTNLIQFFFFWELMLVPSYMLIAGWGYGDRRRVAYKYFLYTQLGSILVLLSILYLGVTLNTFEIGLLNISNLLLSIPERLILTILFVVGFGVKMAIVPLHGWLPEAHAEAPTPISVILSGVMIEVGLYAIIRIVFPISLPIWIGSVSATILMSLALLSMIYGGIMALTQYDVKRLLAYSSISQMGYMFFGVAAATATGIEGSVFHIFNHGLLKGLLFMVAGVLIHQVGIRDMRKLGGLASRMPLTAGLAMIGAMGIAGLPGISGFISEYLIFLGAFSSASIYKYLLVLLATLATAISAAYMTLFIKRVFFGPLKDEFNDATDPPYSMIIPMLILGITAVVLGIYPALILEYIIPSLGFLMGG